MALSDTYTANLNVSMTQETKDYFLDEGEKKGMKGGTFVRFILERIASNGNGLLETICDSKEWLPPDAIEEIESFEIGDNIPKCANLLTKRETKKIIKRLPIEIRNSIEKKGTIITGYWIVESPDGKFFEVYNLKQFCVENRINYEALKTRFRYKPKTGRRNKNTWRIIEQRKNNGVIHAGEPKGKRDKNPSNILNQNLI